MLVLGKNREILLIFENFWVFLDSKWIIWYKRVAIKSVDSGD